MSDNMYNIKGIVDSNIYKIDIISFIETFCNIRLYEYQKILIRNYFSLNNKQEMAGVFK